MMKFYKKKEISLEKTPILFRLERRHTLLEGGPNETADDEPKGRVSRASSVGSYTRCETPDDKKRAATISNLCMSDDNRSDFSGASTVVITESELSSSWLYKARKAKIDSEDEINTSTNSNIPTEENDMQPVPLNDPKLKPVPVPLKPRKEKENVSSCCCYFLVAVTILIASLGIMAAIGGIVYLEVFAHIREVIESQHVTQTTPLKEGFGGSLENKLVNSGGVTTNSLPEIKDKDRRNTNNEDIVGQNKPHDMFVDDSREGNDPIVGGNNEDSFEPNDQFNVYSKLNQISKHRIFEVESKLSHKKDIESIKGKDSSIEDIENIVGNESNEQVPSDNTNDNFAHENQGNIGIIDISKANSKFEDVGIAQNTRFPRIELETESNEHDSEKTLDIGEVDASKNGNPESGNTFGFEPELRNFMDNDDSIVLNRPIVEARPPNEFINRLIGTQIPELDSLTVKDMDRKFTLSEILKHLRTLDVNNRLQSSRQKDAVTETLKVFTQEVGVERKEYLDKLRAKLYN